MSALYKSKAWLQSRYRTKTAAQIAEECGVSEMTITRYLALYRIKRRRSR
ncbi:helix-turn-helix DNA-binding domain protein [Streptomyces phage LilMartin]|nr:helix-turn-helix DNA-binding domain protein [Streptomyces phage LilMartin]QNO12513.1 helix-turn-helix DNA-binding domain protein [Streptomyces phage MulchMansion]UVK61184.1 helix-turn-helix DNA binding domain protein [Streptomyces phage Angela]